MAFLNKGLTIVLRDERTEKIVDEDDTARQQGTQAAPGDHLPLRRRHRRLRPTHQPDEGQGADPQGRHLLHRRGQGEAALGRDRDAVEHLVHRERVHLRQHHRDHRGRHPRGGLPRGAHHGRQQLGDRQEDHQGHQGRPVQRRRHPRGSGRDHLHQARRTAVRGPDQDQARQLLGEDVRAAASATTG